ncbi:hypothetical protein F5887DRAFT_824285, partial [Amanita rubescens]
AVWTTADDAVVVHVLREQKDAGNQSGAGWKKQVWTIVAEALQKESVSKGAVKTATKCSDHWSNHEKPDRTGLLNTIRNASGFGWDDATKTCIATDAVWSAYLATHKKATRWRSTPFPLYDEVMYLVHGIVATGAGAFHPGLTPEPPSTPSSPRTELDDVSSEVTQSLS